MLFICYLYHTEHKHWDCFLYFSLLVRYLKTKEKLGQFENLFSSASIPPSYTIATCVSATSTSFLFFFFHFFFFKHQQLLSLKQLMVSCLLLYLFTLGQGGHFLYLWLFTAVSPLHHFSHLHSEQHQHSPLPLPPLRITPYTLHSRRKGQSASTVQPHITRAQPTRQTVAWGRSPVNIP